VQVSLRNTDCTLKILDFITTPMCMFLWMGLSARDCRHCGDRIQDASRYHNWFKGEKLDAANCIQRNRQRNEPSRKQQNLCEQTTNRYLHMFKRDFRNEMNNYVTKSKMELVLMLHCLKIDSFQLETSVNVRFFVLRAFAATRWLQQRIYAAFLS